MTLTDAGVKFLGRFVAAPPLPLLFPLPPQRAPVPLWPLEELGSACPELLGVTKEEPLLSHPRLATMDPNSPHEDSEDVEAGMVVLTVMHWPRMTCCLSLLGLASVDGKPGLW